MATDNGNAIQQEIVCFLSSKFWQFLDEHMSRSIFFCQYIMKGENDTCGT